MSENRAIQVRLSDRLRSQLEREAAKRGLIPIRCEKAVN